MWIAECLGQLTNMKITLNSFNVLEQNSLQAVFPEIAGEWDFELNAPVTPSMITPEWAETLTEIITIGNA